LLLQANQHLLSAHPAIRSAVRLLSSASLSAGERQHSQTNNSCTDTCPSALALPILSSSIQAQGTKRLWKPPPDCETLQTPHTYDWLMQEVANANTPPRNGSIKGVHNSTSATQLAKNPH
jgi:hypothetical protein